MAHCKCFMVLLIATVMAACLLCALPALSQNVLYDNGPDADVGYYHINFGSSVTNSFSLSRSATITGVTLTIYAVDDRNYPEYLKWSITTEPYGGELKGQGFAPLSRLQAPYLTRFLLFAYKVGLPISNLSLPAGTYYLQLQDVVTRWDTWAFWAQTGDGTSQAYYEAFAPNGAGPISQVASESFFVSGEWNSVH